MKDYIESQDRAHFTFENAETEIVTCIPNDAGNSDFIRMNQEVVDGEAQIIVFPPPTLDDYKRTAKDAINVTTNRLIDEGFVHGAETFDLSRDDQTSALALNAGRMGGQDMATEKFRGRDSGYSFTDTADFDAWFASGLGRLKSLLNDGSDLKDSIQGAVDEAAVDAIVDARV